MKRPARRVTLEQTIRDLRERFRNQLGAECGGGTLEQDIKSLMGCPEPGKKILHDHDIFDMNAKY